MAGKWVVAKSPGGGQSWEIENYAFGKSSGGLCEFFSSALGVFGFLCCECKFAQYSESAATAGQGCVGGDFFCDRQSAEGEDAGYSKKENGTDQIQATAG